MIPGPFVSIHAPRVGRDLFPDFFELYDQAFQSTRPVWGATVNLFQTIGLFVVSIHAPRVGRDQSGSLDVFWRDVSIHAPRVGRDFPNTPPFPSEASFNPRAPCGARPVPTETGGETAWFQSTRPVWGATPCAAHGHVPYKFQSTRPVWGATAPQECQRPLCSVSIHAPRVGRDLFFLCPT